MTRLTFTISLLIACSAVGAQTAQESSSSLETHIVVPMIPNAAAQQNRVTGWGTAQGPDEQMQTRFWWRKGALELGAGANLDLPAQPLLAASRTPTPVIGVRARLGNRTRLVAEADANALGRDTSGGAETPAADGARLALEFKTKSPLKDLRTSLLRVQLSGQSALHFRPRGGGMQVTYRETF